MTKHRHPTKEYYMGWGKPDYPRTDWEIAHQHFQQSSVWGKFLSILGVKSDYNYVPYARQWIKKHG